MGNQYINALADTWNNGATTFHGIKLNVTDSASAAGSRLLTLQIGGTDKFTVSKAGAVVAAGSITGTALLAASNDVGALGASGTAWSDLFLASGGVINWNAGDVTITHSSNALAFAGASSGYSFDAAVLPSANDAAALGAAATSWSDLFLATGGVINFASGNWVATHTSGILTVSTGDLRVTTAGTNAASVATVGGTQTLTGKTLTAPTADTLTLTGGIELGHATDTTLSRGAAGFIAVEGKRVPSPASQAAGDILYRGATEWERLAKGTDGHILTLASGVPAWAAAASVDYGAGNAALSYGGVGTYVLGFVRNTGVAEGSTYAGSAIEPAGFYGGGANIADDEDSTAQYTKGGSALSGTWRAMGRSNSSGFTRDRVTLFLRTV